ncbi:MAG: hypothetical protein NTV32_05045, partial [Gammaproteobacteria bacterium]|nr:hypothetical protein [Gammaproteobacteria bacterium]
MKKLDKYAGKVGPGVLGHALRAFFKGNKSDNVETNYIAVMEIFKGIFKKWNSEDDNFDAIDVSTILAVLPKFKSVSYNSNWAIERMLLEIRKKTFRMPDIMGVANIANGLAQLGVRLNTDDPALQAILKGAKTIDWRTALPINIANTVNGLAHLGVRLNTDDQAVQAILKRAQTIDWRTALPIDIANTVNGLAQLGVRLDADDPAVKVILKGAKTIDWRTALP